MNLLTLLQRHEGKTLEFKRDLSSPVNVLRTIVAFANSAGGMLVIGVEDETRSVKGVEDPLDVRGAIGEHHQHRDCAPAHAGH